MTAGLLGHQYTYIYFFSYATDAQCKLRGYNPLRTTGSDLMIEPCKTSAGCDRAVGQVSLNLLGFGLTGFRYKHKLRA